MISGSQIFDQSTLVRLLEHHALVGRYRQFFALIDWSALDEHDAQWCAPGPRPHPEAAYLKTFLIRICEEKPYMGQVRAFLVEHLLRVLELGFRLVLDPTQPYGFDVHRTVSSDRWLRSKLQQLDPILLQTLLQATVTALQAAIPDLGETVAFDVKQFIKGKGCVKDVNWELSGQIRVTLNRDEPLYHAVYTQQTTCERINSQAQALGIERPKVRNGRSVERLNTLIYIVINVRALQRAK